MVFQKAYDILKEIDGNIGDFMFVDMIADPFPLDDLWHEEDDDYIEFHFYNMIEDYLKTIIIPCTKSFAMEIILSSDCPCEESTWESFGICDDGYSEVSFDYWMQIGEHGGYSEGE